MTTDEYHTLPAVSHGRLETFRESRPMYYGRFVTGTLPMKQPTAAMRLGTILHHRLLEPHVEYALAQPCAATLKSGPRKGQPCGAPAKRRDGNGWWWCGDHATAVAIQPERLLTPADAVLVDGMATALQSDPLTAGILSQPGDNERVFTWSDRETGLPCKCLCDRWIPEKRLIVNLKTTVDSRPEKFMWQACSLGYHRTEAWYRAGVQAALFDGGERLTHLFVVVRNEPPFETAVYQYGEREVFEARQQNREDLAALAACVASGKWDAPTQGVITALTLPRYEYRNEETYGEY